jgi:hypothetical protein
MRPLPDWRTLVPPDPRCCEYCDRLDGEHRQVNFSWELRGWLCQFCFRDLSLGKTEAGGTPCPGCRMVSSENYGSRGLCWTCWCAARKIPTRLPDPKPPRDPDWVRARKAVIAAFERGVGTSRFWYVDEDRFIDACPVCRSRDGWVTVRFIGVTTRVDIRPCSLGCPDDEIAAVLGLEVAR